jgi:hypothetical protein
MLEAITISIIYTMYTSLLSVFPKLFLCVLLLKAGSHKQSNITFTAHITALFSLPRVYGGRCMYMTFPHCFILSRRASHVIWK